MKISSQPLRPSPYTAYRDPDTGQWRVATQDRERQEETKEQKDDFFGGDVQKSNNAQPQGLKDYWSNFNLPPPASR
ncbi:hypothetical protein IQE94_11840 [Synechocystis sp. PCC 7339]|uniref:hypothetical protein n=1 Tax=unclassified Synechocystis TaxID=2640012 RepID=UPI001BB05EAE|nr:MULTISPECIES: hypothetical protein [unclassified Synechocystis]QUS59616.1 hypothetical protein HTZ78_02265 [Synechocystis sp. PCC 7338]UAJ71817.1 hypothetical protein IQE94_11840 [Synechocystis sp. PCC 7339]